jgi:hypothetical protein
LVRDGVGDLVAVRLGVCADADVLGATVELDGIDAGAVELGGVVLDAA